MQVISFRFLNASGPFRAHLEAWATSQVQEMHPPMWHELMAYSTGLSVMQRLESRHSLLKRFLGFRWRQLPATLSATARRKQNKDLSSSLFQEHLEECLANIGELWPGTWWRSRVRRPFMILCRRYDLSRQSFSDTLAGLCLSSGDAVPDADNEPSSLMRELERHKVYALKGCVEELKWSIFRVVNTNAGSNMTLQRASHISTDVSQPQFANSEFLIYSFLKPMQKVALQHQASPPAQCDKDWKHCVAVEFFNDPWTGRCRRKIWRCNRTRSFPWRTQPFSSLRATCTTCRSTRTKLDRTVMLETMQTLRCGSWIDSQ